MKMFLLAFSFILASASSFAQAGCETRPLSNQQIERAYATYNRILKASPRERRAIFAKNRALFKSEEAMVAMARSYVKLPLRNRLALERKYAEWYRGACQGGTPREDESSGYSCRCEVNLLNDDGSSNGSAQVETKCPAARSPVQLSCDGGAQGGKLTATCANTVSGTSRSEDRYVSSPMDSSSLRCGLW